jgi:hypothetical protein
MKGRLDTSGFVTLGIFTFSFIARLVIWAMMSYEQETNTLQIVMDIMISIKAGVISAALYFFVLEMQPV